MIEIETVQRPERSQSICGDAVSIVRADDFVTIAVADGLGHGPEAHVAAQAFCSFVEAHAREEVSSILRGATVPLSKTRGAAGVVVRINEKRRSLEFSGVGNVELRASSQERIAPVSMVGIIGRPLRHVKVYDYSIHPGDLFVLHSDGISSRFDLDRYRNLPVKEIAGRLLADHGKEHDDATCVAIRC